MTKPRRDVVAPSAILRTAREAKGLTQRQLGRELGVTQAQVCEWEGKVEMRARTLLEALDVLGFAVMIVPKKENHP